MPELLLRASSLRYVFNEQKKIGVFNASISIHTQAQIAIVGPSGSGKSTFMAMLAGLQRPQSGEVLFKGQDLWRLSFPERNRIRQKEISFISQFTSLHDSFTIVDNLLLPMRLAGHNDCENLRNKATGLLNRVGLNDHHSSLPSSLSGGEIRRAILARALMGEPSLILADEPTSNLDEDCETSIIKLITKTCNDSGAALVIVTHNRNIAKQMDQLLTLEKGILFDSSSGILPSFQHSSEEPIVIKRPLISRRQTLVSFLSFLLFSSLFFYFRKRKSIANIGQETRSLKLQYLAFSALGSELTSIKLNDDGVYTGSLLLNNFDQTQSLYLLPSNVELYIQQGMLWNPFPANWNNGFRSVSLIDRPTTLLFEFQDLPSEFTQLVPGYLHVRINVTYMIANSATPLYVPIERRDSFFVYLLPVHPDIKLLQLNNFPAAPPLFIPMPPH